MGIIDLREILTYFELDYVVISETKTDDSFPSQPVVIGNFEIRTRKDKGLSWSWFDRIFQKGFCL